MSAPTTNDPVELAMEAVAGDGDGAVARRLLARQEQLVGWQIASERAGFALRVGTGLLALVAVAVLGWMAWTASRADGLVIKPFSVPPDLATRGLTGEAVASQLMDRIDAMDRGARSGLTTKVTADWGTGVSIAIPQTGISLDQLDQWLRDKLGHQTRLSGEVVRGADGQLSLVARVGRKAMPIATGPDADFPRLLQTTADAVYADGSPVGYGVYLLRQRRWSDLLAYQRAQLAAADAPADRADAWEGIGMALRQLEGADAAARAFRTARLLDSRHSAASAEALGSLASQQGHAEAAYFYAIRSGVEAVDDPRYPPASKASIARGNKGLLAEYRHDNLSALAGRRAWIETGAIGFERRNRAPIAIALARLHETTAARREAEVDQAANGGWSPNQRLGMASGLGEWPAVVGLADEVAASLEQLPDRGVRALNWRWVKASALSRLGRFDEARAVIAATPLDCVPCVSARGLIAAHANQPALADHWYREASRMTPSLADAPMAWAEALLARGDRAQAIAQAREANRRAPRWADPLALWGDALMAGGDAKGAEAKYAAAAPLAPRWRDLHLKWAQALAKQGKAEAAAAKRRLAAGMEP